MSITHDPNLDPREPADGDLELFHELEPGEKITFFEWAVEPLEVTGRDEDETVGEYVRVCAEGEKSFIYEIDGYLWHYSPNVEAENNPYPVENLRRTSN